MAIMSHSEHQKALNHEGKYMNGITNLFTPTTSRKRTRERAIELAIANGRAAHDVFKSDWEQAKTELSSSPDSNQPQMENTLSLHGISYRETASSDAPPRV